MRCTKYRNESSCAPQWIECNLPRVGRECNLHWGLLTAIRHEILSLLPAMSLRDFKTARMWSTPWQPEGDVNNPGIWGIQTQQQESGECMGKLPNCATIYTHISANIGFVNSRNRLQQLMFLGDDSNKMVSFWRNGIWKAWLIGLLW